MLREPFGVLLALALAAATPLWQPPNHFHLSMARNIRHLPCVSRRTGDSGTCMFAFSCAKLNGTHLGTCIDRFYFGSCCKVPEESPGGDLDVVPPIEDNSLDGTTTARIRPAVTQKPLSSSTPYVRPSTQSPTTPKPSTQGSSTTMFGSSTPVSFSSTSGGHSPSTAGPSSTFNVISSSQGPSSQRPVSSTQPSFSQRPVSTPGFGSSPGLGSTPGFGGSNPGFGSSTAGISSSTSVFGSSTLGISSSTPGFGSTPGFSGPSQSSTPSISVTPQGSTQGFGSTPAFGSTAGFGGSSTSPGFPSSSSNPPGSSSQGIPAFQQPTTAPPTFVTWTTIEEATGKPPPISIKPEVSEVSGGTHRPTLISSTEQSITDRPVAPSTVVVPVATVRPPSVSSPRPPPSTHQPSTHQPSTHQPSTQSPSTQRPSTPRPKPVANTTRPASTQPRPPPSTARPPTKPQTTKPSKPGRPTSRPPSKPPRPQVTSPKPGQQKPPVKPALSKPKPTAKPKPPTTKPPTRPPTVASTTTARPSTTTQTATSETWVPISVSTHAPSPSTTQPTSKPAISSTQASLTNTSTSPAGPSSPGPDLPTSSVALPSVMSTSPPTVIPDGLNMSNYKDVCGRRLFPDSRVVGGDKSTFGKWPWQISLRQWRTSTYLHKCGAALLNENWAITAAHCVENVPPSDLLLRLGEHDLSIEDEPFGYQERRVQIVASHPQFDPRTFEYDLALLRFYEPVTFQPNIIPICVPEDDTHFVGTTAFVTGWGRLYEDGPLPSVLQEVSVPVINNTLCETMYRAAGYIEHIPDIFICAGWKKGGFDSCEGDSGGPMVIQRPDKRWLLAGVISWGIGCAEPNQPGVYTRISQFRHWINQILQF